MTQPGTTTVSGTSFSTFMGLPYCPELAQLAAAAVILGVPVATPYPGSGLFAAGAPAALRAGTRLPVEPSSDTDFFLGTGTRLFFGADGSSDAGT